MAKSQTSKTKIYLIPCYMKFLFSTFDTSPFDSIWMEISIIGILRAKDLWKNVAILQNGWFTHVPQTPPVIRVVLLLKSRFVQSFFSPTVCRVRVATSGYLIIARKRMRFFTCQCFSGILIRFLKEA